MLSILFTVNHGQAEPITYKGVVHAALQSSPLMDVKEEDVRIAHSTYRSAAASLYPEVRMVGRMERYGDLSDGNQSMQSVGSEVIGGSRSEWRSQLYLTGQYDVSSLYKKRYEASSHRELRDAASFSCHAEGKRLVKEMTELYGRLSAGKIRLHYARQAVFVLEKSVAIRTLAMTGGEASQEEVLQATSDLEQAGKEQAEALREYQEYLEQLRIYTGKPFTINDKVDILVPGEADVTRDEVESGIGGAPEIQARKKELDAARIRNRGIANNYLPDVSLYGRYDYYGSDQDKVDRSIRDTRETGYNAGLVVSQSLFDGGVKKWERIRSQQEVRKQEATLRAAIEEKRREVQTALIGSQELAKSLAHYRKMVRQYGKLREISAKAAELGQRSQEDILTVERNFLRIEGEMKIMEVSLAIYQKRLAIETNYDQFMKEFYGNRSCQY
jgi:outer membrane protein TolC